MTIDPTIPSPRTAESNPLGYQVKASKQNLDSDDFMKLLTKQLATQDPLKPMEDTAFIAQMASFSSLNQMNQLTKDFSSYSASQARSNASFYIGMQTTVKDNDAESGSTTGLVTAVDFTGAEPMISIGGKTFPVSSIKKVEFPPAPVTATGT